MTGNNLEQHAADLQKEVRKLVLLDKFIIDDLKAQANKGGSESSAFARRLLERIKEFDVDDAE